MQEQEQEKQPEQENPTSPMTRMPCQRCLVMKPKKYLKRMWSKTAVCKACRREMHASSIASA